MPKTKILTEVRGFTLIEILVVITMIGILAIILIPNMVGMRQRARDSSRKSQLNHLKDSLRLYYNDYQTYPASTVDGTNVMLGCEADHVSACTAGGDFTAAGTLYLKQLPDDFKYEMTLTGDGFVAWVALENKSDKEIADSASKCGKAVAAGSTFYYVCAY